jgi:hypothetical protein
MNRIANLSKRKSKVVIVDVLAAAVVVIGIWELGLSYVLTLMIVS